MMHVLKKDFQWTFPIPQELHNLYHAIFEDKDSRIVRNQCTSPLLPEASFTLPFLKLSQAACVRTQSKAFLAGLKGGKF